MDNYLETRYHTHPGGPGPSYFEFSINIKLTACDHKSLSLPKSESLSRYPFSNSLEHNFMIFIENYCVGEVVTL